ncbi:dephospho-CoA kinase [Candidatus Woesearchaeota archaeon]|nr:dephospho-CoA kinase [Candidatus Woesearchaeota archaeon]
MIIGITGSIGSGKTTITKLFSKYGYKRIDADEIGHDIIRKNSVAYKKIIKEFSSQILDKNKTINREKLGDIIFNDTKKLKKLNSITHPIIIKNIKKLIKTNYQKNFSRKNFFANVIIDAPLLLETKTKDFVDKIVVAKCDKKNVIKRLSKKYSKEKIEKILNVQMPLEEKLKYADFVIDNNKDLEYLEKQVKKIIEILNNENSCLSWNF